EEVTWSINENWGGSDRISLTEDGTVTALKGGNAGVTAKIKNGNSEYYTIYVIEDPMFINFKQAENYMALYGASSEQKSVSNLMERPFDDQIMGVIDLPASNEEIATAQASIRNYLRFYPEGATNCVLEVTSSDPDILSVSGETIYAHKKGEVEVTVRTENGLETTGKIVVGDYAASIQAKEDFFYIKEGESIQLHFDLYPQIEGHIFEDEEVTWTSQSTGLSVDENGLVTALWSGGINSVIATTKNGSRHWYTFWMYDDPESISFDNEVNTVGTAGKRVYEYMTFEPRAAMFYPYKITSSDESVVRVGDYQYLYGVGPGTATITVETLDGSLVDSAEFVIDEDISSGIEYVGIHSNANFYSLGETRKLRYTISPENYKDDKVIFKIVDDWSGTNDCIDLQEDGTVTAKDYGHAFIRVYTQQGGDEVWQHLNVYVADEANDFSFISDDTVYMTVNHSVFINDLLKTEPETAHYCDVYAFTEDESILYFNDGDHYLSPRKEGETILHVVTKNGVHKSIRVVVTAKEPVSGFVWSDDLSEATLVLDYGPEKLKFPAEVTKEVI
ncbi:MAG: hypothetical protein IIU29_00435, partial [Erysipelotrichaceae bacterium]|nr:hypothetical protein [Erysipelotrichaceae bacterium]